MHALPRALAAAAAKAGRGPALRRAGRAHPAGRGLDGAGARRAPRRRRGDPGRRRRVQPRPARGLPHAAARAAGAPRWPARGRYSPSAVVWHVGVRGELPPGAAHHNIHFGRPWDGAVPGAAARRAPHARPVVARQRARPSSEPGLAPAGRHVLYVLEPVPNLDGRVDWTTERARARDDLAAAVAAARLPDRHRGRRARRPARLGGPGHGARHAVRPGAHVPPDRAVPPRQREPQAPGPGLRRLGHRARASGSRWCWCPGMLAAERVAEVLP